MPRLIESDLAMAAKTFKAKAGVGCDGVHPKVPLQWNSLKKGEAVRKMAATSLHNAFLLDSEECH